jgi:undecaprenyl-diphosphatase
MKAWVNSFVHWDIVFATAIFGLNGKKLTSFVMPWISHSGNGYYYPVIPAVLLLINPQKAGSFFLAGLFAFAVELPLYKFLKISIKRLRPYEVVSGIHGRVSPIDQFSFPSGHTAAAFVMATLLSYFFPIMSTPMFCWALLVGFSRIYLGVHYPTDILAGIVIGLFSATMALIVTG